MKGVNKAIVVGHLGQDPDIRYTQSGNAVANLSVATTEEWKDKQTGEKKSETEWHRCVLFGKVAEIAGEYLRKGSPVYLEGKIKTRKWQDRDGQDRYTTEIHCRDMQMLGSKGDNQGQQQAPQPAAQQATSLQDGGPGHQGQHYGGDFGDLEEPPF